jgi:transposase
MDTYTVEQALVAPLDTLGRKITQRHMRSVEEKERIVRETLEPGTSVAEIARRHGVNANLLFGWRRQHQQGLLAHSREPRSVKLLPIELAASTEAVPAAAGSIEIELPTGERVKVVGDVNVDRLWKVLAALARDR